MFWKKKKAVEKARKAEAAARLLEKLAPCRRTAWFPQVAPRDSSLGASKFCGRAVLPQGEDWPQCPSCKKPKQLFLQLQLSHLPERPRGCPEEGWVQLFYCTTREPICEVECEAFFPYAASVTARWIPPDSKIQEETASPLAEGFPPKTIVDWKSHDDFPHWEEFEALEIALSESESDLLCDLEFPKDGDKLMGWPAWVQGIEYPNCSECGAEMTLLFQIESDDHIPHSFGDLGCGHLTFCPKHPHILAFGWACT